MQTCTLASALAHTMASQVSTTLQIPKRQPSAPKTPHALSPPTPHPPHLAPPLPPPPTPSPTPGDAWDLSNLLIDGQPPKRLVALAWLRVIYSQTDITEQQPELSPGAVRLSDLLLFADAIASPRAVIEACCARFPCSPLRVPCPPAAAYHPAGAGAGADAAPTQGHLLLDLNCWYYPGRVLQQGPTTTIPIIEVCPGCAPRSLGDLAAAPVAAEQVAREAAAQLTVASKQLQAALGAQIADALEPLLFAAAKLGLSDLEARLMAFVRANHLNTGTLLPNVSTSGTFLTAEVLAGRLFTERVVQALGPERARGAAADAMLRAPVALFRGPGAGAGMGAREGAGAEVLLRDVSDSVFRHNIIFDARMAQGFSGIAAGAPVSVVLGLDEGGGRLTLMEKSRLAPGSRGWCVSAKAKFVLEEVVAEHQ